MASDTLQQIVNEQDETINTQRTTIADLKKTVENGGIIHAGLQQVIERRNNAARSRDSCEWSSGNDLTTAQRCATRVSGKSASGYDLRTTGNAARPRDSCKWVSEYDLTTAGNGARPRDNRRKALEEE
jgi:hypothetical protein